MLLFIVNIAIVAFFIIEIASANEPGCRNYGKRMARKIRKIQWACRPEGSSIEFLNKGTKFNIKVVDIKTGPGIKYETIPAYSCKDIYINDEVVCKVHCLESLFSKTYVVEYSNKRHDHEIEELINKAYKKAKQIDKEYWENWSKERSTNSSFYTKEKEE